MQMPNNDPVAAADNVCAPAVATEINSGKNLQVPTEEDLEEGTAGPNGADPAMEQQDAGSMLYRTNVAATKSVSDALHEGIDGPALGDQLVEQQEAQSVSDDTPVARLITEPSTQHFPVAENLDSTSGQARRTKTERHVKFLWWAV